mgnify:CR=1 FL=1|tara:strand:+ start:333 stop:713 length:381 start_codon:yes stop_codon:yes gene_type:complete
MEITEVIGWVGNVVVIISFLQKNIKKLRVYGLIGALIWIVYAIRIESNSLIILNLIIMGIQSYHLWKIRKEEKKKEYPWMYPITPESWKDTPPIVSSLEMEEDFPIPPDGWSKVDLDDIEEDPFVS